MNLKGTVHKLLPPQKNLDFQKRPYLQKSADFQKRPNFQQRQFFGSWLTRGYFG